MTSYGDGEFILTASPSQAGGYRLRVDATGRAGELAPPGILLVGECRDIAASPGGTVLAYAVWNMSPPPPADRRGGGWPT